MCRGTKPPDQVVDDMAELIECDMNGRVRNLSEAFFVRVRRFPGAEGDMPLQHLPIVRQAIENLTIFEHGMAIISSQHHGLVVGDDIRLQRGQNFPGDFRAKGPVSGG